MSRWRYGCGRPMEVYVPRGYDYKPVTVQCGSTAHHGGVNQCGDCSRVRALRPPPVPEYGDDLADDVRALGNVP
jgi:hypothetical protein